MQSRNYIVPSARSRTQIKHNMRNTLEKQEYAEDAWLNDASPTSRTHAQAHTVHYEELPTMPLSMFSSSLVKQNTEDAPSEELLEDTDKTIKLNRRKLERRYGPLDSLLQDKSISIVTALSPKRIYIERNGQIQETPYSFIDEQHMVCVIERLLRSAGQSMPTHSPLTDVRLPDGSFLTVAMPPSAVNGPALTIRKSTKKMLTMNELVEQGWMSQAMADVLLACVQARLNIIACGHVGSGRTTLLNALCAAIPERERIVTIEEVAELRLKQSQVVGLLTQRTGSDTTEQVTLRDLLIHAQRMQASRIIVGECRGNEATELLQAMYSGLDGSMMTMYAHNVKDCLTRFETLCLAGSTQITPTTSALIRTQIAQSLNIVVSLSPEQKITNIAEIQYADGDPLKVQSLFHYRAADKDTASTRKGIFEPSGFYPTFMEKCEAMQVNIPRETFLARATL